MAQPCRQLTLRPTGGSSVTTDRRPEATSDERWRVEADDTWGDRPGIVASLLRYRWLVVAVTVMAAVAGYAVSQVLPIRYEAETTVILRDPGMPAILDDSRSTPSVDLQAYVAKQADIMVSGVVLTRALRLLRSERPLRDVRRDLDVRPSKDLASVTIRAKAGNADAAVALANAVGSAYQRVTADRASEEADRAIASLEKVKARLQAEIDAGPKDASGHLTAQQETLAKQIADLDQRAQNITTQAALHPSGVELFDRAERPESPTQPKPKLNALLGALLGLIGAGAWAWWAAARHQRAERRDDPAPILGAPLLGEVPRFRARRSLIGKRRPSDAAPIQTVRRPPVPKRGQEAGRDLRGRRGRRPRGVSPAARSDHRSDTLRHGAAGPSRRNRAGGSVQILPDSRLPQGPAVDRAAGRPRADRHASAAAGLGRHQHRGAG